jgi:methylated-DNA-[protein]-cysteine S-methyltransferase
VIPCHRVLGSDGGLHGYGAGKGLETKAWLLELEGVER